MKEKYIDFLYWLTGNLKCRRIDRAPGQRYMERYYLTSWLRIHRLMSPDKDAGVHDHPYPSVAIILAGGYKEDVAKHISPTHGALVVKKKVRWVNFIPANKFHRITEVLPDTWTLVIRGPDSKVGSKKKGWGYVVNSVLTKVTMLVDGTADRTDAPPLQVGKKTNRAPRYFHSC